MKPQSVIAIFAALLFGATLGVSAQSTASCIAVDSFDAQNEANAIVAGADESRLVALAEYHPVLLKTALDNYAVCLRSDNRGVVESALGHLVRLKLDIPDLSAPWCLREIRRLVAEGETQVIRVKARLATMICDDPSLFNLAALQRCKDADVLFAEIATQLRSTLLGAVETE